MMAIVTGMPTHRLWGIQSDDRSSVLTTAVTGRERAREAPRRGGVSSQQERGKVGNRPVCGCEASLRKYAEHIALGEIVS